jgi:hypothetical protein
MLASYATGELAKKSILKPLTLQQRNPCPTIFVVLSSLIEVKRQMSTKITIAHGRNFHLYHEALDNFSNTKETKPWALLNEPMGKRPTPSSMKF